MFLRTWDKSGYKSLWCVNGRGVHSHKEERGVRAGDALAPIVIRRGLLGRCRRRGLPRPVPAPRRDLWPPLLLLLARTMNDRFARMEATSSSCSPKPCSRLLPLLAVVAALYLGERAMDWMEFLGGGGGLVWLLWFNRGVLL